MEIPLRVVFFCGGLGNQLFQYAFYYRVIKECGNCYADMGWFDNKERFAWYPFQLEKLSLNVNSLNRNEYHVKEYYIKKNNMTIDQFELINKKLEKPMIQIVREENTYKYDELWKKGNAYYIGYFQNIDYLKDTIEEIRNRVVFPENDNAEFSDIKNRIINDDKSVSIHVRMNDYPGIEDFEEVCDDAYYNRAIDYILNLIPDARFYVFSNRIELARKRFAEKHCFEFVDINDRYSGIGDMELISLCRNNIISNSTFSWWSAVLNKNHDKTIIAPMKFDIRKEAENIGNDINLYFEDWITL